MNHTAEHAAMMEYARKTVRLSNLHHAALALTHKHVITIIRRYQVMMMQWTSIIWSPTARRKRVRLSKTV